jgi:hypothetical protein
MAAAQFARMGAAHYARAEQHIPPYIGRKTGFLDEEKITRRAISRHTIEIKFSTFPGFFSPRQIDPLTIVKSIC